MDALLLPLVIFLAKVAELTVSTSRTILVVSGMSLQAALLGFVEITIGILAVGAVVTNLDNPLAILAYSAGFAVGIIAGGWTEERLAFGFRTVQVINPNRNTDVSRALRERGYPVTQLEGLGRGGPVEIVLAVIQRRSLRELLAVVATIEPTSFVTVERTERPVRGTIVVNRPRWQIGPGRFRRPPGDLH